jgi:hypothetical protein
MANRFVADMLSPRRKRLQKWVVLLPGFLGHFCAVCICKVWVSQSPGPAQVVINAPITRIGNKPKTTAQTTNAETIKMSCLHKADRPIGYLKE